MPGNEEETIRFLLRHLNKVELPYIGLIRSLSAPTKDGAIDILNEQQLQEVSSHDSKKKADFYLNGRGISAKQSGGSNLYNRLQRNDILNVFRHLEFQNPEAILDKLDIEVLDFHQSDSKKRNKPWSLFFNMNQFLQLLEFLMLKGSPNLGISPHQAEFILESTSPINSVEDIRLFTFRDYFEKFSESIKVAIRRQWIGQKSNSESKRAVGLAKKEGNLPWVFRDVSGQPSTGWNESIPEENRRTVYFLMIEKVKSYSDIKG